MYTDSAQTKKSNGDFLYNDYESPEGTWGFSKKKNNNVPGVSYIPDPGKIFLQDLVVVSFQKKKFFLTIPIISMVLIKGPNFLNAKLFIVLFY